MLNQSWIKYLTISEDLLVVRTLPALNRVNWSIICTYHNSGSSSGRSTATVSLYVDASGRLAAGFDILHTHLWPFVVSWCILCLCCQNYSKVWSLSAEACLNCLSGFSKTFIFSLVFILSVLVSTSSLVVANIWSALGHLSSLSTMFTQ